MKSFLFLAISVLISASSAQAVRHAGNGGGVSEQNIVFAFENVQLLTVSCQLACDLSPEEKNLLTGFGYSTHIKEAVINFQQENCHGFQIQQSQWNICLPELLSQGRDWDLDGFLDLGESLSLLLRMDSEARGISSQLVDSLCAKLVRALSFENFNFVFNVKNVEFHIFGYRDVLTKRLPIFIQSQNAEQAISLESYLKLDAVSCPDFQLSHPYVADQFMVGDALRVILVFPMTVFCGSEIQGISKHKILEIEFFKDQIQIL